MRENKKYEGSWFLPISLSTKRQDIFQGSLTFDPDEGTVLILRVNQMNHPDLQQNVDILLGDTSEGPVTLYKCVCYAHHFGDGAIFYYHIQFIFEGGHLNTENDFQFTKISAELNGLNEWVNHTGFKLKSNNLSQFKIDYKLPKKISFKINENLSGCFDFRVDGLKLGRGQRSFNLVQHTEVIFEAKDLMSLHKILNILTIFSNLLMLGIDHSTFAIKITLYSRVQVRTISAGKRLQKVPFSLLFPRPPGIDIRNMPSFRRMFFTLNLFKNKIEDVISKWFDLYSLNESAMNLFFKQYHSKHQINPTIFLNYAQVAESYHGEMAKMAKRDPDKSFVKMKKEILAVFNKEQYPEHFKWLHEQFNRQNPLTLYDRLSSLAFEIKNTALHEAFGDIDKFIIEARDNRNYYTHYNKKKKHKAFDGLDLYNLTRRIQVLLIFHFLQHMGFRKKEISSIIVRYFHLT